jgi:ferritin-like protein
MATASQGYHEAEEKLSPEAKNMHRALVSLQEELEAVDWYRQRADVSDSADLKAVLLHNMEEEMEHACMLLEWLRRHDGLFERKLRTYLFQTKPITEIEAAEELPAKQTAVEGAEGRRQQHPLGFTVGTMKRESER